jgi:GT2 family glycosyltransferase
MSTEHLPTPVTVPENRYDLLADGPALWEPTVGVAIPVYNHGDRLRRTLSGLARQSDPPDAIVIADDGSDEDVSAVAAEFSTLPLQVLRQEHVGFGAGRARNMGARNLDTDVVVFLDADCIPASGFIAAHRRWHRRSPDLVVIGNRYHVIENQIGNDPTDDGLRAIAEAVPDDGAPDDWRRVFYSKTRWIRTGDDGFRAFVSANVSVTASVFRDVGGFAESFTAWGGEDTELGWRLWNAGATFAVESDASCFHQVGVDETRTEREAARLRQRIAVANLIPHRFYRPGPAAFYTVAHVSFVVHVESNGELLSAWEAISKSGYPDTELIAVGGPEAVDPVRRMPTGSRHDTITSGGVPEAVRRSRGEFVILVDGRVRVNPRVVTTAVGIMSRSPRIGVVHGAYIQPDSSRVASGADIATIDGDLGRNGLPMLAAIRRRELAKELAIDGRIDWERLSKRLREGLAYEASELAGVSSVVDEPSRIGVADVLAAGPRQTTAAIGAVVSRLRNRGTDSAP